jgi:tetratricopeptide (TPR) repeat protein
MPANSLKVLCVAGSAALLTLTSGCSAKAKVARHVARADAYFAKGDFESARIEYLNAFRLNQNDPHVAQRLGESFIEKGDLLPGAQMLARARDLQPTNTAVRLKLGSLLLLGGNPKEARQEAEAVLKQVPADPEGIVLLANSAANTNEVAATRQRLEALLPTHGQLAAIPLGLGILSQKMGDLPAAEQSFEQAVKLDPKSSKNNFALANICFGRGETNKAEIHYKAAVDAAPEKSIERLGYAEFLTRTGRVPEAKTLLEQTVAKAPDFAGAWNALTQISFAENNADKASEYIGKVLAVDPNNHDALLNHARVTLSKRDFKAAITEIQKLTDKFPRDSQSQYQLALAQLGNNENIPALASLDKAISLNPNNIDAVLLRCRIQISKGDLDNAIPELNRIVRRYPQIAQAHYLLAAGYRQRRANDDAIAVYENMTKLFPKDPQPFQLLGSIYAQAKNEAAARQAYEKALKINSDFLPAIDDLIELDILAKQYDAAFKRVAGYIEKYPTKPMPRLLQAKVYFAQQKNAEAETSVKKAIELDPEFYIAHRTLADFYVRSKQTDQAISTLQAMIQKNSKDVASLVQLGMLYESKDDYKQAQQTYEAVLKVNPNSTIALNNLAYILGERVGDVDGAVQLARKAHDLVPSDPFMDDTFGWMLWKKGDYSTALISLQQAVQEFNLRGMPQPEVLYHAGMACYMTGAITPAINYLESSLQSTNEFNGKDKAAAALAILKLDPSKPSADSIATLQKTIADNPGDVLAYTKLAQVFESQSNWDKARENYEKALEKNPKSTLVLSHLASLYIGGLKNPERALDYAKQAWAISQNGELGAKLGPIGYNAGEYQWAYGLLLEAQRSQPDNPTVAYYSGVCAFALGKIPQAQNALQRAIQNASLDAKSRQIATALNQLCAVQLGTGAPGQAQSAEAALASADPTSPAVYIAAGLAAEEKGDFNSARQRYEAVLKAQPSFVPAQRQLTLLLAEKLADDTKASELGTPLRRDFPEDAALSKALGKIAYRAGDYSEAARLLKSASAKYAKDADLLYHLGLSQFKLGEKAAKRSLTEAISLDANNSFAADAKKALAQLK